MITEIAYKKWITFSSYCVKNSLFFESSRFLKFRFSVHLVAMKIASGKNLFFHITFIDMF